MSIKRKVSESVRETKSERVTEYNSVLNHTTSRMDQNKWARTFITAMAIIGCSLQLQSTFVAYFSYESTTRTSFIKPGIQEDMSISMCTSYAEMIDYSQRKDLQKFMKRTKNFIERDRKFATVQELVTIRDILQLTPSNESLVTECGFRFVSTRLFTWTQSSTFCRENFKTTKYYTQEFVCYLIRPAQTNIPQLTYTSSLTYPRQVYVLRINSSFSTKITFVKFVIHSASKLPYLSKQYSSIQYNAKSQKTRYTLKYVRTFLILPRLSI